MKKNEKKRWFLSDYNLIFAYKSWKKLIIILIKLESKVQKAFDTLMLLDTCRSIRVKKEEDGHAWLLLARFLSKHH